MAADPRDRFPAFTGHEHLFVLVDDPLRMIRNEVEHGLREQVADTVVDAITMEGEPKVLTVGQRGADDTVVAVSHFGFCLRARLAISHADSAASEELVATLTFLFGHLDRPGQQQLRTYFDLDADADAGFTDAAFDGRFEQLRTDLRF